MINQFVATKIARPAMSPVTTPWTVAFSRISRVNTRLSSALLSSGIGRLLGELEESPEEMEVGAAPEQRHPDEQAGVSQEGEAPAAGEAGDEAIGQPQEGAGPGHLVAWEVLAEQGQEGVGERAAPEHDEERRQEEHKPADGADREPEGDAVELDEDLGQPGLEDPRELLGSSVGLAGELLVILLLGVDVPDII